MCKVFKDKRHLIEFCCGIAILLIMILFGALYYGEKSGSFLTRMLVGGVIGYGLARASFGFAGSVNRAYNTGSTKLMKALAILFLIGSFVTFIFVLSGQVLPEKLSHNSLNWGLLIGATMFGFGMSMTVCCASGVLTDLAESPIRAILVLLFFCLGAYLGLGLKRAEWMAWYTEPIFGIDSFKDGVNFADWFKGDGTNGALSSLILTTLLVFGVLHLASLYENKRKRNETYIGCDSEIAYEEETKNHVENENPHVELFYRVFVKRWSLLQGALAVALGYLILMVAFKATWGVSGPLGEWFGRLMILFGVSPESVKSFTGKDLTTPFFQQAMYIQDISIFLGALIAFLLAGNFTRNVKSWFINPLEIILFAIGGIFLGIAINIAGGCNAGGLFSPIVQFSLSGWIYLVCIVIGGILGNMVRKKFRAACKIK